jgi:hypothetical protein
MGTTTVDANKQVEQNQQAYEEIRGQMERNHMGRTLLMRDGEVVAIYPDDGDANITGRERYGLGNFSLVTVGAKPIDLGFFTIFVSQPEE